MPVDIGSIKRNDQIAGAAAILAFILALLPWARTGEVKDEFAGQMESAGFETSDGVNLWHGVGILAALLLLVAVAALAAAILERSEVGELPIRWISTGLWALASLFTLIFIFTSSAPIDLGDVSGVDKSEGIDFAAGWSGYLLLLACIVATVFAAMGAQESGEKLPGRGQSAGPAQPTPPPAA